jgi:hypothetical protein
MIQKLSLKERREQFIFLLLLALLSTGLLGWVIFNDNDYDAGAVKKKLSQKIRDESQFEQVAAEMQPAIDSTYKKIVQYDPSVQALFLETDVQNAIGAIRAAYQRRVYDSRYKCFQQQARFFEIMFTDRKELRGNIRDIDNYNKSLTDCSQTRADLQTAVLSRGRR